MAALPGGLVLADGEQRVLDGLVRERGERVVEEVQRGQQGVGVARERALRVGVVQELRLQLGRLLRQLREALAQRALRARRRRQLRRQRARQPQHARVLALRLAQHLDLGLQLCNVPHLHLATRDTNHFTNYT